MKEPRLRYLSMGKRNYPEKNILLFDRDFWEFQAVIEGRIAAVLPTGKEELRSQTLWVSEPGHTHLWSSKANETSRIVVFHLPSPDEALAELVIQNKGMIALDLEEEDIPKLISWHDWILPEHLRPNGLTHLKVRQLLDRLTLLALERAQYNPEPVSWDLDKERVESALYWYERNLIWHPQISDVAKAVGVSDVHLRRIFLRQTGHSPKVAFKKILMQYAETLIEDTGLPMEEVAERCGFSNSSSFSRAYKSVKGNPPSSIRKK